MGEADAGFDVRATAVGLDAGPDEPASGIDRGPAPGGRPTDLMEGRPTATSRLVPRWVWPSVVVLLAAQFVVVALYSQRQFSRFDLSTDFAGFNQAVWLIAHGHLDPWSSINSFPFLDDYFALIAYPMAALYWVYPHGVLLLWLQDGAGVLAEVVAARWVIEIAQRRLAPDRVRVGGTLLALGAVMVMVANPWFYQAMFFDFHPEAMAALFLVLAVRAAWSGRTAWAVGWSVLLLSCGDLGGLYLAGLGLSLLFALPRRWWWGAGAIAAGLGWLRVTYALGVSQNPFLSGYAYLQSGSTTAAATVTFESLFRALVVHPGRWLRVVWERRGLLYQNLIPTGVVGLFSAWSSGTLLVVLGSSVLILPLIFLQSGFQNLPAYVVALGGSALVLCRLARMRRGDLVALVVGLAIVAQSLVFGLTHLPGLPGRWISVSPAQAHVLQRALERLPASAEVVADWGVIGPFSDRQWVYNLYPIPVSIPIHSRTVAFVVVPDPATGDEPLSWPVATSVITFLKDRLDVTALSIGHGIDVYLWHPSTSRRSLVIP